MKKAIIDIISLIPIQKNKFVIFFFLSILAIFFELINLILLNFFVSNLLNYKSDFFFSSYLQIDFEKIYILYFFVLIYITSNIVQYSRDVFAKHYSNSLGCKILIDFYKSIISKNFIQKDIITSINMTHTETNRFSQSFFFQLLLFISKGLYFLFLCLVLLYILPKYFLFLLIIFATFFIIFLKFITFFTVKFDINQKKSLVSSSDTFQELIFNFLEIKLFNLENNYLKKINKNIKIYLHSRTKIEGLISTSKYLIDSIFFIGLISVVSFIDYENPSTINTITIVIFVIFRALPSFNQTLFGLTSAISNISSLNQIIFYIRKSKQSFQNKNINTIQFNENLTHIVLKIDKFSFTKKNILFNNFYAKIDLNKRTKIIGNNGTGKTTLFYIITKIIKDKKIDVQYFNKDKKIKDIDPLCLFSIVPQKINLFDGSIKENIILNKSFDKTFYNEILTLLRINKLKYNLVDKLSGGEKQKVAIARALYTKRPYILMDEPFSALDFDTGSRLQNYLIKSKNIKGVIIITHQVIEDSFFQDKIHLM